MMNKITTAAAIKGKIALLKLETETFVIPEVTNKATPTGGVIKPITRFKDTITPKWTGSIPSWETTGINTGTIIMIAASVSRNIPIMKSSIFINNRTINGLVEIERIPSATSCGILSKVKLNPKIFDVATIIIIVAVMIPVLRKMLYKFFHLS